MKMMEDMNYPNDDEMMVEGISTNQDPDDCGEFKTFGGDNGRYGGGTECGIVVGGVVSGNYDKIIHEGPRIFNLQN